MRDQNGFPGIEKYNPDEMANLQAFVRACFKAFDYSWQHPRIVKFMQQIEKQTGHKTRSPHQLSFRHYQLLGMLLADALEQEHAELADRHAYALALASLKTAQPSLVGAKS